MTRGWLNSNTRQKNPLVFDLLMLCIFSSFITLQILGVMAGSNTNIVTNSKPLELLLVGSVSSDPYSVLAINPITGISQWSYKGAELQNSTVGIVRLIGKSPFVDVKYLSGVDGKHFMIGVQDRPIVHIMGLHPKDRYHVTGYLPESVTSFVTSRDGLLLFMAIKKSVFVWMLSSGCLIASFEAHYQDISDLALSFDASLLFTASLDGSINVYLVADIVRIDREITIVPLRKWRAHSLGIRAISVSSGGSPRVVSVGMDHVVFLHSVSMDLALVKITAERPLTACIMDRAETKLFVGTDVGGIAQVNLYSIGNRHELLIQTSNQNDLSIPTFNHCHTSEISKLAINCDGTILASGDVNGKYCLWDIASRQCIKVSTMKGLISSLEFLPNYPSFSSPDFEVSSHRPRILQGKKLTTIDIVDGSLFEQETRKKMDNLAETILGSIMKELGVAGSSKVASSENIKDTELCSGDSENSDEISRLREEVSTLRKVNQDLFQFGVKLIMGKDIS